jgi:hydroxymethylglutaryl-CoA reductase (NADPH)
MFISPSMLDRVYVRGSLKNTELGYEFKLKNNVDNATLSGVKSLTVDGNAVSLSAVVVKSTAGEKAAEEITYRSSMPLYYNSEMTVKVSGEALLPGAHSLVLSVAVYEAGTIQLKIEDEIV